MEISEKCRNNNNKHNKNNSDNPLASRRTDGGKNTTTLTNVHIVEQNVDSPSSKNFDKPATVLNPESILANITESGFCSWVRSLDS